MKLNYPAEPNRFTRNHMDDFVIWAMEQGTSDITIQTGEQIMCDIHNKKLRVTKRKLSRPEVSDIISYIYNEGGIAKLNAGEDIASSWLLSLGRAKTLRLRTNITGILTEGHKGYEITLRLLNEYRPPLDSLGLPASIIDALDIRKGLVLFVGSTGSGKSTLAASILDNKLENPESHLKILTYEAPIEYTYDNINKPSSIISQTEIPKDLPSFAEGIRNALRRKADALFVGELRDLETVREAIKAVQKGHLVLSTTHSNGVADTLYSLINEFPTEEKTARAMQVLSALKIIVGQMLVSSTDGKRVAIREYLIFNDDIRKKIITAGLDDVTGTVKEILKTVGQSFAKDAKEKLEKQVISERTYYQIMKDLD